MKLIKKLTLHMCAVGLLLGALAGCMPEGKIEATSPLIGTYTTLVDDEFMAEVTLRSDGVFTYMRAGKNIYDRAYGNWEVTDEEIVLKAMKRYPNTWGGPELHMVRQGPHLITVIANIEVVFEMTDSLKESLQKSEDLRLEVLAR